MSALANKTSGQGNRQGSTIVGTKPIGQRVKLGSEVLLESGIGFMTGKRVGVITNHTGVLPNGEHVVDAIRSIPGITIAALFSPEHGIRGDVPAGAHIGHEVDPSTGVQVYSLYGEHNKPERSMLEGVDTLVYDIQDIGTRFYTYISTLALAMETAAENGIPFVVLDRPMVTAGNAVDGPMIQDDQRSFIGMLPLPILYSLTPGELAGLIQEEYLRPKKLMTDVHVVKMSNYRRSMWYDETGFPWRPPSPNVPTVETAIIYPGAALVEGTNVSEGRGTPCPFKYIGAPFVDGGKLAELLNSHELPGVTFQQIDFTPRDLVFVSHPRFKDKPCHGIEISVTDRNLLKAVEVGVAVVCALKKLYPAEVTFRGDGAFDRLAGDRKVREMIDGGASYNEISAMWEEGLKKFGESRKRYFLY